MKPLIIISLLLLAVSCGNKRPAMHQSEGTVEPPAETTEAAEVQTGVWVFYERTACFGTCPVFRFTLNHDGTCTYEGVNFVDRIGLHGSTANDAQLAHIREALEAANYTDLHEVYDNPMITDLPAVITEVSGQRVVNRIGGPDLKMLYDALDVVIDEVKWTPIRQRN